MLFLILLLLSILPKSSFAAPPLVNTLSAARRDPYTPHVPPQAIAYQRNYEVLALVGPFWHLLGLALLLRSGLTARLRDSIARRTRRAPDTARPPALPLLGGVYGAYVLLSFLWSLPLALTALWLEHRYGFGRQSVGGYFRDAVTGIGINILVNTCLIWGGYWLYFRSPRHWWKWLWAALVPLLLFQYILQPVVIAPLYNRYTPLAPGRLRDEILSLAAKAGITGGRVFVEDTSRRTNHVNAYVTGVGPTTRIVLNDTALQLLPEDQLLAMVGHEMGHYVEGHLWINLASAMFGAGIFLALAGWLAPRADAGWGRRWGANGLLDAAALPLMLGLLYVFTLAQEPIASAESRVLEHRADAFGLRVTGLNDATARLFVGFAERDYGDPDPPALLHFWFGTHPTLKERIAFARAYRPDSTR